VNLGKEQNPTNFREKRYSPHTMRHTTATHMLEAGVPIMVIKNFLGHATLQSTQIYTEVTQGTLNKYIKAWSEKWGPIVEDCTDDTELSPVIPDFLLNKGIRP
jgi:integrase